LSTIYNITVERNKKRNVEAYHGELGHTHIEGLSKVKGFRVPNYKNLKYPTLHFSFRFVESMEIAALLFLLSPLSFLSQTFLYFQFYIPPNYNLTVKIQKDKILFFT